MSGLFAMSSFVGALPYFSPNPLSQLLSSIFNLASLCSMEFADSMLDVRDESKASGFRDGSPSWSELPKSVDPPNTVGVRRGDNWCAGCDKLPNLECKPLVGV